MRRKKNQEILNIPPEAEANLTKRSRLLERIRSAAGSVSLSETVSASVRPPVDEFNPRHTDLVHYARRNASLADVPLEDRSGIMRFVFDLNDKFGSTLQGHRRDTPKPNEYGFSKKHSATVFKWGLDEKSMSLADNLLYVVGAMPSGEPEVTEYDTGLTRTLQEFTSSTGLQFTDIRETAAPGTSHMQMHNLYAYIPAPTIAGQ